MSNRFKQTQSPIKQPHLKITSTIFRKFISNEVITLHKLTNSMTNNCILYFPNWIAHLTPFEALCFKKEPTFVDEEEKLP